MASHLQCQAVGLLRTDGITINFPAGNPKPEVGTDANQRTELSIYMASRRKKTDRPSEHCQNTNSGKVVKTFSLTPGL